MVGNKKQVNFATPRPRTLDDWVTQTPETEQTHRPTDERIPGQTPVRTETQPFSQKPPKKARQRLTLDIDRALHRRIKVDCFEKEVNMLDAIEQLLTEHWPPPPDE